MKVEGPDGSILVPTEVRLSKDGQFLLLKVPLAKLQPVRVQVALPYDFTDREKEVYDGLIRELPNKQIADELHIAVRTVKFHVSNILRKIGIASRTEANLGGLKPK